MAGRLLFSRRKDISGMAETSVSTHIIPTGTSSVKSAMSGLLAGLPIRVRPYAVTLGSGLTAGEFSLACGRLFGVQREVIVCARLQLGEAWVQWQEDDFRVERAVWNAALRKRLPDEEERKKYLRPFYECAGVVVRWPERFRSDRYNWTYYLSHEVEDGKIVKRGRLAPVVPPGRVVSHLKRDDGEFVECVSASDKVTLYRWSADVPVRDERTVKP